MMVRENLVAFAGILLVLFLSAHADPALPEEIVGAPSADHIQECMASTKPDQAEFEKMKPGYEPSEKMFCFLKCIGEKEGIIKADGSVDQTKIDAMPAPPHVKPDKANEVKECFGKVTVIKECKDMQQFAQCVQSGM